MHESVAWRMRSAAAFAKTKAREHGQYPSGTAEVTPD